MIRIVKGEAPEILTNQRCRTKVAENIRNQTFTGSYYNHGQVLTALETAHHGKCCYCESKIRPVMTPQIEHYRPKNTLKDDDSHIGYYWLGHEWANLLLACSSCNVFKSSWFPITGIRVLAPTLTEEGTLNPAACLPNQSPLLDEQPLIINPEYDNDPESHFLFLRNGMIQGRTQAGQETINKCRLNDRSLPIFRKKIIDDHVREIEDCFGAYELGIFSSYEGFKAFLTSKIQKILNERTPDQAYTLLRRQSLADFQTFYLASFPTEFHGILNGIFQELLP